MINFPYTVIKSKRKTLTILVDRQGNVIVKVPLSTTDATVYEFVDKHRSWIEKHIVKQNNKRALHPSLQYVDGETLLVFGKKYSLKLTTEKTAYISDNNIFLPTTKTKENYFDLLKLKLTDLLQIRVNYYSSIMKLNYLSINVKKLVSKWAYCSYDNNLVFTVFLGMCPLAVIDYVIVHELSHIVQKNHSKSFWNIVLKYFPDYKIYKKWLQDNSQILKL